MGLTKFAACAAATLGLFGALPAHVTRDAVRFLTQRETASGGFSEPGEAASPQLTAWAVLGLRAAGETPSAALGYLVAHEGELRTATDVELAIAAESALGREPSRLIARLRTMARPSGAIGGEVNSTAWGILALRQAGAAAPPTSVRFLLSRQARSGGWSWAIGGAADSNDTAAAIEALGATGLHGRPIRRGLDYLRRRRHRDGGFELAPGSRSDAQSTAWAIQAFAAAGVTPPRGAAAYLQRLQRKDGSFSYSAHFLTTPTWVTAQVLPALLGRAFPLG